MKIVIGFLFLLIPFVVAAQGVSEGDMQNMMEQMQKMQSCMEKVDQAEVEALDKRSTEVEAELKSLCDKGKRDEAQEKAVAYGKEMMKNPAIQQMKECSEMARGVLPEDQEASAGFDFDFSKRHVCD